MHTISRTHAQRSIIIIFFFLFFAMALPAHLGPRSLIQFRNHFSQMVGFTGLSARRKAST
jgi:hypothetical protein